MNRRLSLFSDLPSKADCLARNEERKHLKGIDGVAPLISTLDEFSLFISLWNADINRNIVTTFSPAKQA
jgi:hypothetical protein